MLWSLLRARPEPQAKCAPCRYLYSPLPRAHSWFRSRLCTTPPPLRRTAARPPPIYDFGAAAFADAAVAYSQAAFVPPLTLRLHRHVFLDVNPLDAVADTPPFDARDALSAFSVWLHGSDGVAGPGVTRHGFSNITDVAVLLTASALDGVDVQGQAFLLCSSVTATAIVAQAGSWSRVQLAMLIARAVADTVPLTASFGWPPDCGAGVTTLRNLLSISLTCPFQSVLQASSTTRSSTDPHRPTVCQMSHPFVGMALSKTERPVNVRGGRSRVAPTTAVTRARYARPLSCADLRANVCCLQRARVTTLYVLLLSCWTTALCAGAVAPLGCVMTARA